MDRKRMALLALLIALSFTVSVLFAGGIHFNRLDFNLGDSLRLQGELAGIGNLGDEPVVVELTGLGTVTAMCENRGGHRAPGRNPIAVEVEETGVFEFDQTGKAVVEVTAPDPTAPEFEPSPTPKEAGCPSATWRVVDIVDGSTNWTGATVVVTDQSGTEQINLSFTCVTTFEDGVATDIDCSPN
jgi:hypothetical protein